MRLHDAGGSQTRVSRIARVGSSGPRSRWWWMVSPTKIQPSPGFSSGPRPPLRIRLTLLTGISAYALTDCLCALLATTPLRPRDLLVAARTVFESMMMMMGLQVSLGLTSSFSIPRLLPRVRFCPNVSPIFVSFFPLCGVGCRKWIWIIGNPAGSDRSRPWKSWRKTNTHEKGNASGPSVSTRLFSRFLLLRLPFYNTKAPAIALRYLIKFITPLLSSSLNHSCRSSCTPPALFGLG